MSLAHLQTKQVEISTRMNNINQPIGLGVEGSSGFSIETIRQLAGDLWTPYPQASTVALDNISYEQSLDADAPYRERYLPIHSNYISAAIRNSRNDFLITIVAPLFETNEKNFTMSNKEWNQIAFDDIPEGGIANEPTYTKWGWTDSTRRCRQNAEISVDLAHDPNYGLNVFMENFAELASNGLLTLYKNVAYALVSVGYENMIQDRTMNIPFDISKLYQAEAKSFLAFAADPDNAFELVRELENEIDGADLVITPEGGTKFMTQEGSTIRELPARVLTYDSQTRGFTSPENLPGPKTFRSYPFGERWMDVMEMRSFTVNSLDKRSEKPLAAKLVLCQFFPPNPDIRAGDMVTSTSPELLDMWIFHQTKEKGENVKVSFKDCLKNCNYWDIKTGEISEKLVDFIDKLNERNSTRREDPWQFTGPDADVNKDIGDYDNPSPKALRQISTSHDILAMKSIRHKFCGALWDTDNSEYTTVDYIGSNHLDVLTNEWIERVGRSLGVKFTEVMKQNTNEGLSRLFSLLENIKSAPVTADYLSALIDENMAALKDKDPSKINGIPEFRVNAHGSLRLPTNKTGALIGMKYPNGFHSGPGLLTLRDQQYNPGTIFYDAAMEAKEVLLFVEQFMNFIRNHIGASEIIGGEFAAPWFQLAGKKSSKSAEIATFIDALYAAIGESEGPVFLGVPPTATTGNADDDIMGSGEPPSKAKDGDRLVTFLTKTPLNTIVNFDGVGGRVIVDDSVRALCCLSIVIAETYKELMLVSFKTVSAELFKFIITTTGYGKNKTDVNAIKVAGGATQKFYAILQSDGQAAADAFIEKISGTKGIGAEFKELAKSDGYTKSTADTLAEKLFEYEAHLKPETADVPKQGTKRKTDLEDKAKARDGKNVAYYDGDYDAAPTNYMRSSLMSSPALVEFIRFTNNWWAVPADKATQYSTPDMNVTADADDDEVDDGSGDGAKFFHSPLLSLSGARLAMGAPTKSSSYEEEEEDYYYGSSSGSKRGLSTTQSLFNFGARTGDDRFKQRRYEESPPTDPIFSIKKKYIGPWKNRLKYCDKQIHDRFQKIMFRAIIQTRNTRDIHYRLADIGAKLMNVIIFRPFIELVASSVIVMKKGEDTCATPYSRFDATISKEDRGFFHIGCSFHYGFIRRKPQNIRLIPYCMPERFIGGKKTDFMTHANQWEPRNPLKPSMIVLPIPVTEITFASPIHMLNKKTVLRPDIDMPTYLTKYSSWEYYEHIYDSDNVRSVDEAHEDRHRYYASACASHVAYMGCRYHKDATTLEPKEYDGSGPGNLWCMNTNGAQYVMNGQGNRFPQPYPTMNTRARGTV